MAGALRRLRRCGAACLLIALAASAAGADPHARAKPGPYVQPCAGITLSASYLAEAAPGQGPGFLFRIENRTAHAIRLEEPVPSSAHWYARVGNRWLWRASAGRGGALVNALNPKGPIFAYTPPDAPPDPSQAPQYLTVPAHGSQQWFEAMLNNPAIAYQPSCPLCNYPGESEYQAVFAYAYLPNAQEQTPELLHCGLRSDPVPMPKHPASQPVATQ